MVGQLVAEHAARLRRELGGRTEQRGDAHGARGEPRGRDEHEPPHQLGMPRGERDGHGTAERMPHEVDAVERQAVGEPVGDRVELEAGPCGVGGAEARHVHGDDAPATRERPTDG